MTVDDALDVLGCERSCVYRQQRAVMALYCGSRGEYVEWGTVHPARSARARAARRSST